MTDANSPRMSLRKLATILGVSQPFLSQKWAGKRPLSVALRGKVEALGAYHLLMGDKQVGTTTADERGGQRPDLHVKHVGGNDWVRTSDLALMKYYC